MTLHLPLPFLKLITENGGQHLPMLPPTGTALQASRFNRVSKLFLLAITRLLLRSMSDTYLLSDREREVRKDHIKQGE